MVLVVEQLICVWNLPIGYVPGGGVTLTPERKRFIPIFQIRRRRNALKFAESVRGRAEVEHKFA